MNTIGTFWTMDVHCASHRSLDQEYSHLKWKVVFNNAIAMAAEATVKSSVNWSFLHIYRVLKSVEYFERC